MSNETFSDDGRAVDLVRVVARRRRAPSSPPTTHRHERCRRAISDDDGDQRRPGGHAEPRQRGRDSAEAAPVRQSPGRRHRPERTERRHARLRVLAQRGQLGERADHRDARGHGRQRRRARRARRRSPAASAPATSASGESPACSAASGAAPASSSAWAKIAPSGLACPSSADATAPSTSAATPVSSSRSCSEKSQLETTTSRRPRARSSRSAGATSGIGAEVQRGQQRVDARRRRPAPAPSPRRSGRRRSCQRGGVAALVQVRAVVRDLGPHRRGGGLLRDLDAQPLAQRCAQSRRGRLERDQRAERVEEDCLRYAAAPRCSLAEVLKDDGEWWIVVGAIVVALVLAFVVERLFSRRAERLAAAVTRGELSRETATRLRFVRRLIYAVILLIGVAIALSQFAARRRDRRQPARLRRRRRRDHRLRRPPDAGQLRGRRDARGHAADPRRRLGQVRGPLRRGRRRAAELHDPAHGRRDAAGHPEREARRPGSSRTTRWSTTQVGLEVAVWIPPGGRRRAGAYAILREESGA